MKKSFAPGELVLSVLLALSVSGCSRPAGDVAAPAAQAAAKPSGVSSAAPAKAARTLPDLGPAPAWQLKDVNGAVVSSEQFKGKVVVVDFWATWCPPCREEIPGYIDLTRRHGPEGLVIVGISLDQAGPEVVKTFAGKTGINYPLVMGDEEVVAAFGGMTGIPTTFLIDRAGRIRDRKEGLVPTAEYEQRILAVLK